ncbi:hypothetical protein AAVH_37063 [Aphelenchoides avenae]|nr:hypothetical protein AAVH_37063 [Aphelenchus avenae]
MLVLMAITSAYAEDKGPNSDLASVEALTEKNHGELFSEQRGLVPPHGQRMKRQYSGGYNYYGSPSYGYNRNYGYSNGYNGYNNNGYGSGNGYGNYYNYPSYNYGTSYANNNGYTTIGRIPGYRVEVGAGFECFGSSFTSC